MFLYPDFRTAFDTISHSVFIWTRGSMSKVNGLFGGLNCLDHRTQISCSMFICKVVKSGVLCKVILGPMFSIFIYDPDN